MATVGYAGGAFCVATDGYACVPDHRPSFVLGEAIFRPTVESEGTAFLPSTDVDFLEIAGAVQITELDMQAEVDE